MKTIKTLGFISLLSIASFSSQAEVINFETMAEATGSHGESAWDSLNLTYSGFSVSISATKDGNAAFAYLDSGNGGLGVCGEVYDILDANKITNSDANLCNPGSDDNVTVGESLFLTFDTNVIIENLWFNNNHDTDHSLLGDTVTLDGSNYTFDNGGVYQPSAVNSSFYLAAGTTFEIAYFDEPFYLERMQIKVPETSSLILLLVGMLGLSLLRKRII